MGDGGAKSFSCLTQLKVMFVIRGRVKNKKKIVEFSTKVGGWGQQWTDFP